MATGVNPFDKMANFLLPKSLKVTGTGSALTPTYDPQQAGQPLAALDTNNHIRDLLESRRSTEDSDLIAVLMQYDSDMGAAVNAYLTLANTTMRVLCKTPLNEIDTDAQEKIEQLLLALSYTQDYSLGFTKNRSINSRNAAFRYSLLKRGSIGAEMILGEDFGFSDLRMIDTQTLEWSEPKNGKLSPMQKVGDQEIKLDIPTFFYTTHRQDPNSPYSKSFFISAINTIYARLQIINDLYNIMQVTGYPRIKIKVIEEVIDKNMPEIIKRDPEQRRGFIQSIIGATQANFASIRPDQPLVHTDSFEIDVLNHESAGMTLDIRPVIEILDAQNQASLKSMATILGRGESGVNTASVEAQLFSMSATELNEPISDIWSAALTFALRLAGSTSYVEVWFDESEMRPPNELEPALVQRQARLLKDLSLGNITDVEYHLKMYNRLPPKGTKPLSGTNFLNASSEIDASSNTPQKDQPDSRQRAATKKADSGAKSNAVK